MDTFKKESSVEWLYNELALPEYGEVPDWVKDSLKQAIEMHKEEIKNAVIYGMAEEVRERYSDKKLHISIKGDENIYYNNTFKTI